MAILSSDELATLRRVTRWSAYDGLITQTAAWVLERTGFAAEAEPLIIVSHLFAGAFLCSLAVRRILRTDQP